MAKSFLSNLSTQIHIHKHKLVPSTLNIQLYWERGIEKPTCMGEKACSG